MAININDCANTGSSLAYLGKQHLDAKASVQYITDLESLNDYLPNYSIVIVEDGDEAGTIWQLQPDGSWTQLAITGNAAMLDDDILSTESTYSSSKIDNTFAKVASVYDKTTADATFGTLAQQETNTTDIATLKTKTDSLSSAMKYKGNLSTYGELMLLEDMEIGDMYIIETDETRDMVSTKYIYNGEWVFNGTNEITIRNFETNPINLGEEIENEDGSTSWFTEVKGKLRLEDIKLDNLDAENVSYENGTFTNVKQALDSLLYKDLSITFSTSASTTLEKGNVVANPVFNWTYSKDIVQQNMNGTVLDVAARTYTHNGNVTSNTTFTLKANDGTKDFSKSVSFSFYNAIYSGYALATNTIDSSFVIGLQNKKLSGNCKGDYTVNCPSDNYIYIAIPSNIANGITFYCGGFEGGFSLVADNVNIENIYNSTCDYNIYRSDNHSLGQTTITIK